MRAPGLLACWWSVLINKWFALGSGKVGSVFRRAGANGPSNPPVGAPQTYGSTVGTSFLDAPPHSSGRPAAARLGRLSQAREQMCQRLNGGDCTRIEVPLALAPH